jgi:hypothetical protein
MENKQAFINSLSADNPPAHLSPILKSLWFDAKGDWKKAHDFVTNCLALMPPGCTPICIARKEMFGMQIIGTRARKRPARIVP